MASYIVECTQFEFAWFFSRGLIQVTDLWQNNDRSAAVLFLSHLLRWCMISVCTITDAVHFDHKVVSAMLLYYKVSCSPFVINVFYEAIMKVTIFSYLKAICAYLLWNACLSLAHFSNAVCLLLCWFRRRTQILFQLYRLQIFYLGM